MVAGGNVVIDRRSATLAYGYAGTGSPARPNFGGRLRLQTKWILHNVGKHRPCDPPANAVHRQREACERLISCVSSEEQDCTVTSISIPGYSNESFLHHTTSQASANGHNCTGSRLNGFVTRAALLLTARKGTHWHCSPAITVNLALRYLLQELDIVTPRTAQTVACLVPLPELIHPIG